MMQKTYDIFNHVCSPARHGALLHDDGAVLCILCNHAGGTLKDAEVRGCSRAHAVELGWSIDTDEDDIGLSDGLGDPRRKRQVRRPRGDADGAQTGQVSCRGACAVPGDPHNLWQARLERGKMGRVPCCDPVRVYVDHVDHDLGVVICHESGSWTAYREEASAMYQSNPPVSWVDGELDAIYLRSRRRRSRHCSPWDS